MIKCRRVTWTLIFSFSVSSKLSWNMNSFQSIGSSRFINFGHLCAFLTYPSHLCAFSTYPSFSRSLYASLSLESHSILTNPLKYKHQCYSLVMAVRLVSDDSLTTLWRLSDDSDDSLTVLWRLSDDSLTTFWRLSDDSLMYISDDSLVTDKSLMTLTTLWRPSDDSRMTPGQISGDSQFHCDSQMTPNNSQITLTHFILEIIPFFWIWQVKKIGISDDMTWSCII